MQVDDESGELTGDHIAYLYPDLELALLGSFRSGVLVEGREVAVTGHRYHPDDGVMRLTFSRPREGGPVFRYDPPGPHSFGDQPLERDPLDRKYVSILSISI